MEDTIRDGIIKQGGTSLKSVICPTNIKPVTGEVFECVGVLDSGSGLAIAVQQRDAQGNIAWDFASVKGLLNMPKLQASVQERLQREVGVVSVDCGSSIYRPVKPGEVFECKLLKRNSALTGKEVQPSSKSLGKLLEEPNKNLGAKANQPDTIQVTIEPSGDISWQRIVQVQIAQASTSSNSPGSSVRSTSQQAEFIKPSVEKADLVPSTASSAGKSAEEFLNQPGATDDFD